jgi:DNA/RNA-binding domain of Phe-tRNA-synthetase-like protein
MLTFRYDAAVLARFPTVVGGVILARGLRNGPTSPALLAAYQAEQRATIERLGTTPLSQVASLAAWRRAFSGFGVEPTQYRSAAEALLRRLTKQGDIPSINHLVDLGNLVSIRHALPVAVFDARAARGAVTVRFAGGSERFTPLGQPAIEHPEPGEVIFADDEGQVLARRWCWRQSAQSAARDDTQEAIITVEAHHAGGRATVAAALDDLRTLLAAGGADLSPRPGLLDATTPALTG